MNRRTKIIVSVAGIFIVTLALIGLTYAYFLTRINGNTNAKSISVSTAKLELTYSDNSSEILGSGKVLQPSSEPIGTKTFTVTNNGEDTNYSVVLENMSITNTSDGSSTEFYSNDFVYTLTCKDKSNNPCVNEVSEETVFPLSDGAIINNDIAKSDVHNYTLTLWYKETGIEQSNDMNKTLSAKINIIDPTRENPYKLQKDTLAYHIINNSINRTNGTNFVSTPKTIPAEETTSFEYIKAEDPTTFTSSRTSATSYYISYADDYTVNKTTGKFTLVNPTTIKYSTSVSASDIAGKYAYWSTTETTAKNTTNLSTIYKITTNTSDITSSTIKYASIRSDASASNTISTERELSFAPDDYGTSYYYRGGVEDNYLELNNMCFRIVRIQGDGSIKITLAKEGKCSSITSSDIKSALINNAEKVVYGYDTDGTNKTFNYEGYSGGLYTKLNNWYSTNLSSVQSKLKNETWCLGGKTSRYDYDTGALLDSSATNDSYYYETGMRLFKNKQASYKCASEADVVTGYVGALLADEVAYAGVKTGSYNYTYYLYDNAQTSYWSLSRSYFYDGYDGAFYVYSGGRLSDNLVVSSNAVRPAVTIATGAEIASGDGTIERPYTIK